MSARQTDTQTDINLSQYFATAPAGEVIISYTLVQFRTQFL